MPRLSSSEGIDRRRRALFPPDEGRLPYMGASSARMGNEFRRWRCGELGSDCNGAGAGVDVVVVPIPSRLLQLAGLLPSGCFRKQRWCCGELVPLTPGVVVEVPIAARFSLLPSGFFHTLPPRIDGSLLPSGCFRPTKLPPQTLPPHTLPPRIDGSALESPLQWLSGPWPLASPRDVPSSSRQGLLTGDSRPGSEFRRWRCGEAAPAGAAAPMRLPVRTLCMAAV